MSPSRVRTIVVGPRRATTRAPGSASSGLDRGHAVGASERAALGLAHHLAGHQHHVTVDGGQRRDDQRRQVVAGTDLGDAVRRQDGERHVTSPIGRGGHRGGGVVVGHVEGYGGRGQPAPRAARASWSASASSTSQPSRTPPCDRAP